MWRSQARSFLFKFSITRSSSKKSQVRFKPPSLASSRPNFINWNSPVGRCRTIPSFESPRLFAQIPESIDLSAENMKETDDNIDGKNDILDARTSFLTEEVDTSSHFSFEIEKDGLVEKDVHSSVSPMIHGHDVEGKGIFDEVSDLSSAETGDSFEEGGALNETPNLISEEVDAGVDKIDSFTTEEAVEETMPDVLCVNMDQVENVISILQSSLVEPLESTLDELSLDLNEEFAMRVIETPQILGENLIRFFRWASKKQESSISSRLIGCLVHSIGVNLDKREVYSLWDLVKEIGENEKGLLTTNILNELISLFWKLRKGQAGLEAFNMFADFGCEHDSDSYYLTVEALFRVFMYDDACTVCEKMLSSGSLPSEEKIGKIIVGLCKGRKLRDAHSIYRMARDKEIHPPESSFNFLINKLSDDNETVHLAAEILEVMSGEARKDAIKPFTSVLRGLCRIQNVKEAQKLLLRMTEEGPPPGNVAFNYVITGLSKAGDMDEALSLVEIMKCRGLIPDIYSYNVIVSGFSNGGMMDDASRIFAEAKKIHPQLCRIIYHTLIRGYCKIEEFDKALQSLSDMKESGIKPNADEYNKLIQSLCLKALDWRAAEKLWEDMKESGLYLNGITIALIRAVKEMEAEEMQLDAAS